MPNISVVLPAYNEEKNIAATVQEAVAVMERVAADYEVVVVDDGSRDGTAEVVRELARRYRQVRLVQHPVNQGYGAALATGFASAQKDLIFLTDGDKQFDLAEVAKFLALIPETELVIGYRAPRCDPFHRRLYGWGWNWLVNLLFGHTARDVDCAFKLFRRKVLNNTMVRSRGATFSAEFLVRAKRHGYRIRQVPVKHLPRLAGKPTGGRLDVILRAFKDLLIFRWQLTLEGLRARQGKL